MTLLAKALSEFLGTALLVSIVVGSGIMAESLTDDLGLMLLLNQLSTVCGLGVLIAIFLPISGAHLNPAVTITFLVRRQMLVGEGLVYIVAQALGALGGTALAHVMFGQTVAQVATNDRLTPGTFVGELVATAGLIVVILLLVERDAQSLIPLVVPLWIGSAYIFTSSTSFANPAVTLGRMFTDSFSGISPPSGLGFIGAQMLGLAVALLIVTALVNRPTKEYSDV